MTNKEPLENTYSNRVAKFKKDQKASAPIVNKMTEKSKPVSTENPYLRARNEILDKYPNWKKKEVQTMEAGNDLNNPHYLEFVKEVAELGDSFSA